MSGEIKVGDPVRNKNGGMIGVVKAIHQDFIWVLENRDKNPITWRADAWELIPPEPAKTREPLCKPLTGSGIVGLSSPAIIGGRVVYIQIIGNETADQVIAAINAAAERWANNE